MPILGIYNTQKFDLIKNGKLIAEVGMSSNIFGIVWHKKWNKKEEAFSKFLIEEASKKGFEDSFTSIVKKHMPLIDVVKKSIKTNQ